MDQQGQQRWRWKRASRPPRSMQRKRAVAAAPGTWRGGRAAGRRGCSLAWDLARRRAFSGSVAALGAGRRRTPTSLLRDEAAMAGHAPVLPEERERDRGVREREEPGEEGKEKERQGAARGRPVGGRRLAGVAWWMLVGGGSSGGVMWSWTRRLRPRTPAGKKQRARGCSCWLLRAQTTTAAGGRTRPGPREEEARGAARGRAFALPSKEVAGSRGSFGAGMDLAGGWLDGENEEGGEGGGGMGIDGWDISLKFRVWSDLVRGCPLYIVGG